MKWQDCFVKLGIGKPEPLLPARWQESEGAAPLNLKYGRAMELAREHVDPGGDFISRLTALAGKCDDDEYLNRFTAHIRQLCFVRAQADWLDFELAEVMQTYLGEEAGLYPVLVLVSALPELEQNYKIKNIPAEIFRATVADIRLWLKDHFKRYGKWGVTTYFWLQNHLNMWLFRLGRLQFIRRIYQGEDIQDREGKVLVSPGTGYLEVHVPADGRLDPDECRDSLKQAGEFYRQFFPKLDWQAYICESWLMDNALRSVLPADSNIIRFQELFEVYPYGSDSGQMFERVFDSGITEDYDSLPQDTALQRNIVRELKQGRKFENMRGVLVP